MATDKRGRTPSQAQIDALRKGNPRAYTREPAAAPAEPAKPKKRTYRAKPAAAASPPKARAGKPKPAAKPAPDTRSRSTSSGGGFFSGLLDGLRS